MKKRKYVSISRLEKRSKYPVRKLVLLNFWVTFYFILLAFVFAMANSDMQGFDKALKDSLLGGLIVNLNAFINLALLLGLEKKVFRGKISPRKKFYMLSFLVTYPVYLLVIFGYAALNHATIHLYVFMFIIIICILINTFVLVIQNYIIMHDAKVASDMEISNLKAVNADTANQLLRQQIHPHFLFNTLNILKSLYRRNPDKGEEYLIHLSNFLRASVSKNNLKIIPLIDELTLCEDYLEMQKIRFGNALNYTSNITRENLTTGFVPSFSIQPLLENAIKHNELTEECPLHIVIQQEGDRIRVTNNVKLKSSNEPSSSSGLANLSERYQLLSGNDIIIEDSKNEFSVSIKILSHENSNH